VKKLLRNTLLSFGIFVSSIALAEVEGSPELLEETNHILSGTSSWLWYVGILGFLLLVGLIIGFCIWWFKFRKPKQVCPDPKSTK
jgi:preprotein translocase subunit SecY